jgi:hypothetical protein
LHTLPSITCSHDLLSPRAQASFLRESATPIAGRSSGRERRRYAIGAHRLYRPRPHADWIPLVNGTVGSTAAMRQIELVVVDSNDGASAVNSTRNVGFVGFLRITKTASTALLDFLRRRAPHAVTYDYLLDYPAYFQHVSFGDMRSTRCNVPACVFGGGVHPHAVPSVIRRMSAPSPSLARANISVGETVLPRYVWQCPHTTYRNLVATWARGIPFLDGTPPSTLTRTTSATLQVFTIIRDPTERYVSYFHYWRQIYPHWKDLATPEEQELLLTGNLPGFVELQSRLNETVTINSAFQYRYLSDSVDDAIAMVREYPARIMVLINECFEVSLRLLAETFPQFVDLQSVETYLGETTHVKYTQGNASIPIVLRATSEMGPVQPYRLDDLRHKSRTSWLADDYRFYEAAVDAFKERLAASRHINRESIQECYRRLDSRRVDETKPPTHRR